ncbi:hypothetical protein EIMP300_65140 [Escherichia coli]|uniref:Uncharacterized protein n=1 Tax=Escherichia coli TaxID=562 RepID=A0A8S0FWL5_ECOLX|nr:hypothetical protein EIMP300_65140 [Escherichia coli]
MKQKSGKKISINWRHQIRFWVVQTGYQIEVPPATGKQDEMAEEENGGSRTVTG